MKHLLPLLLLLAGTTARAQEKIMLYNPSFEDVPGFGRTPKYWMNCGPGSQSPPDVQPGQYNVELYAHDGRTYLGLMVRDNETWESVGQKLSRPLKAETTYSFSLFLARSPQLLANSALTGEAAEYTTPVRLLIWGGMAHCDKQQLLAASPMITNGEWQEYAFELSPDQAWTYLTFEAYYKDSPAFAYNGHILIDHCSLIVERTGGNK